MRFDQRTKMEIDVKLDRISEILLTKQKNSMTSQISIIANYLLF